MAERRGQVRLAQVLLVAAAAGLWVSSRLTWVAVQSFDGLGPPKTVTVSGAVWSSALLPLAMLLAAAAIAALAVRGWTLRMLAVLVAVASLAIGYLAISMWVVPDVAVRGADLLHVPVLSLVGSQRRYLGAAITLLAAPCTLAGAVLLMRAAASSRGATTKYVTPAARRSRAQREDGVSDEVMSERMIWDALDEGRDLTQDRTDRPQSESDTEGR